MRVEIKSASDFLSDLLRLGNTMNEQQLVVFRHNLEAMLRSHYLHHWFPERPARGSGYRCLRINHKMDPLIARAARGVGIDDSLLLRSMFPHELTLWIDPREVSYRIGENGSICVLYDGTEPVSCESAVTSSGSNGSSSSSSGGGGGGCKDSVRAMDHLIMDRSINLEQYVSS